VKKPARFEDEADAEYRAAGRWYEERVVGLGIEFFDAVDAALNQIARLPKAGARFPYHVVYLETSSTIRVLAIAHDRRRPGYWTSRL
jgi:toxin ParE1/3/4